MEVRRYDIDCVFIIHNYLLIILEMNLSDNSCCKSRLSQSIKSSHEFHFAEEHNEVSGFQREFIYSHSVMCRVIHQLNHMCYYFRCFMTCNLVWSEALHMWPNQLHKSDNARQNTMNIASWLPIVVSVIWLSTKRQNVQMPHSDGTRYLMWWKLMILWCHWIIHTL